MNSKTARLVVTATAAALLLAGCGGGSDATSSSSSNASTTPSNTAAPEFTDQQAPPDRLTIDVTIKNGEVTPTNESLQSGVNQPIVFRVLSDKVDVLHVHSNPEHSFAIDSKSEVQGFQFTPTVPGKIDVELHDIGKTVATITVQ